jgi:cation transport protein ChaC
MQDYMWVFGYGSLMWDPGFEVAERSIARLNGYARSFCMWSIHHRGTEENPGLVLALDEQDLSFCDGLALAIAPENKAETLAYLRERELISSAYLEKFLKIDLTDGRQVEAVTYVIDVDHVQYCGGLPLEKQRDVISSAIGGKGHNVEYLVNTASHLEALGIQDLDLQWLSKNTIKI